MGIAGIHHVLFCTVLGLEPRPLRLLGKHHQLSFIFAVGSVITLNPCTGHSLRHQEDVGAVGAQKHVESKEPHGRHRSEIKLEPKMVDKEAPWQPF